MRTTFRIIACAVGIAFSLQCPGDTIFSKGELSTTKNHTGNVWLKELNAGDSTFDYALAVATFDAGGKAGLAQPSRWSNPAYSGRHWLLSGKRTANTNCPQRGCNQVSSRRRALARCIADQRLYLSGNYTDSKGKNSLVRAGDRQGLPWREIKRSYPEAVFGCHPVIPTPS